MKRSKSDKFVGPTADVGSKEFALLFGHGEVPTGPGVPFRASMGPTPDVLLF